jgi:hypothetical protein
MLYPNSAISKQGAEIETNVRAMSPHPKPVAIVEALGRVDLASTEYRPYS